MNNASIIQFLLWCSIINYMVLLVWFAVYVFAHDVLYRFHTRWFRLSVEQFDLTIYCAMAVYKMGILLLNIVPLTALWIIS